MILKFRRVYDASIENKGRYCANVIPIKFLQVSRYLPVHDNDFWHPDTVRLKH